MKPKTNREKVQAIKQAKGSAYISGALKFIMETVSLTEADLSPEAWHTLDQAYQKTLDPDFVFNNLTFAATVWNVPKEKKGSVKAYTGGPMGEGPYECPKKDEGDVSAARQELHLSVNNFYHSARALREAMAEIDRYGDVNDLIQQEYPIHSCFNEWVDDLGRWTDRVLDNIDKAAMNPEVCGRCQEFLGNCTCEDEP